jgi:hypothetical protein
MTKPAGTERTVRLMRPPTLEGAGVLCVSDRKRTTFYAFREIACEIGGRGFAVHKLGLGMLYHVRIGTPEECSCECMGFLRHGKCRHILALLTLVEQGLV